MHLESRAKAFVASFRTYACSFNWNMRGSGSLPGCDRSGPSRKPRTNMQTKHQTPARSLTTAMPVGTPSKRPPVLRRRRDSTTSGLERQASCPVIVTATPSVTEPSLNSDVEIRSCVGSTSALQPVTDEQPSVDPPSNEEETDEGGGLH